MTRERLPRVHGLRCEQCDAEFSRSPSDVASVKHLFCSRKCCGQARTGGMTGGRPPRKTPPTLADFEARYIPEPNSGCFLWTGDIGRSGYGRFRGPRGLGPTKLAHRWAWELLVGPIPSGMFVCHRCDNPPCVNPGHLFIGSHADNMQDMANKGRAARPAIPGSKHPNAKLTEADVSAIRNSKLERRELAEIYGIGRTYISQIKSRQCWKHIP
jgi:hypothetical protein